jgi:hypothetical protein
MVFDKLYCYALSLTRLRRELPPGETLIKSPLRGGKSENREIFDIFQDFCIFKGRILPMKGDICPIWA